MITCSNKKELREFCAQAISKASSYIAIDTEFIRTKTYWPNISLLQLAIAPDIAIVLDVQQLSKPDLSPLKNLLTNQSITKVFHSARQDVEILLRLFDCIPTPIFDTQIGAMLLNVDYSASYSFCVQKFLKEKVDSALQRSDWLKRPLSQKQLYYALSGVTHLCSLYEKIYLTLQKNGRILWIQDIMLSLSSIETYSTNLTESAWQLVKGAGKDPNILGIINAIARWREEEAQNLDIPRQFIINDKDIIQTALSKNQKKNSDFLSNVLQKKTFSSTSIQKLKTYVEESRPITIKQCDHPKTSSALTNFFKALLQETAERYGIPQHLIVDNKTLACIAHSNSLDWNIFHGWRYEVFGETIKKVKEGIVGLSLRNGKLTLAPTLVPDLSSNFSSSETTEPSTKDR